MTEAQPTARSENAQISTAPHTREGRKRSSLNAFRHGLTGQILVQTPEDQEAFKKHCDGIREALAPLGALETDLAQAIAEDRWRLNRARALENSIFALGQTEHVPDDSDNPDVDAALAQGRTWIAHARELNLLTTYESRIRRSVEKNTAELRALQAERKSATAEEESSVRFFKRQTSDPPEPEPLPEPATQPSRPAPPQRVPPQRVNPRRPAKQRPVTPWEPKPGEWVRNPIR